MDEPKRLYWMGDPLMVWGHGLDMDFRFRLASDIVKHCALVVGIEDGEDAAGRRAYKLLSGEEVARRAMTIAETLVTLAEEKGYIKAPVLSDPRVASHYAGAFGEGRYFASRAENEKYWKGLPSAVGGIPGARKDGDE